MEIYGEERERERVTGGKEKEEPRTALFWLLFGSSVYASIELTNEEEERRDGGLAARVQGT